MSAWNAFGYFAVIWIASAASGGSTVQRLMACRDSRHSGLAMAMFSVVYFGLLAWPWIITALGSLVLLPVLPEGVTQEAAYLRVARMVLPVGFQGILFAALTAAFISSINSLLNWGSSYIVNDLYRRFLIREAGGHHYVTVGRIATVVLAVIAGFFATRASSIQQLLQISYVVGGALGAISVLRWLWPGLTAMGELAAMVVGWVLGILVALGLADRIFGPMFGVPAGVSFSSDFHWMGARVFGSCLLATSLAAIVSVIGPKTDPAHLAEFARRVQMPVVLWGGVMRRAGLPVVGLETLRRTLLSWAMLLVAVVLIIVGVGRFLTGPAWVAGGCFAISLALFWLISRRLQADAIHETLHTRDVASGNQKDSAGMS
jgi:Na+/proline symporter